MPRIFFGNFDFEHELAASDRANRASETPVSTIREEKSARWPPRPSTAVDQTRQNALAAAWMAVAEPNDLILTAEGVGPPAFSELATIGWPMPRFLTASSARDQITAGEFVPWGWTESMVQLAAERGWSCSVPPLRIVRQINSRRFRFELETEFGVSLPGAAIIDSVEFLQRLVAEYGDAPFGWILKSNYGMAGRESVRGRGPVLSESLLRWAQKQIAQVGCVVLEPVLDSLAEAGVQIEIPAHGAPRLIGVTPLLVDRSGTYRGSRFGWPDADVVPWQPAIDVALRVAGRVQQLGYFGPLGIDAMSFRTAEGERRLRPLQDLNARFTMGRLALGLERILPTGWCASWLHAPRRAAAFAPTQRAALLSSGAAQSKIVTMSPDGVDSNHSILVLAESAEIRDRIETEYFRAWSAATS